MGGALAFWLWNVGLEHTMPTRVAVTVAVNPIVAAGLGVALLGEPVAPTLVIGLAAVLAGIALTARPQDRPQREVPVRDSRSPLFSMSSSFPAVERERVSACNQDEWRCRATVRAGARLPWSWPAVA